MRNIKSTGIKVPFAPLFFIKAGSEPMALEITTTNLLRITTSSVGFGKVVIRGVEILFGQQVED